MELAQALILTNALGGLSSLGRSTGARMSARGGMLFRLGEVVVEILGWEGTFHIYCSDPAHTLAWSQIGASQDVAELRSDRVLPARLLLHSPQGEIEIPLSPDGDHLTARFKPPQGPFLIACLLYTSDAADE